MDHHREELRQAIEDRAFELRLPLKAVAELAHMSEGNLRRIRNGEISLTRRASADLETALRWEKGHIRAILDGAPTPEKSAPTQPAPAGIDPKRWESWDDTGRQVVLDALAIAENRDQRNHPDEGERARGA